MCGLIGVWVVVVDLCGYGGSDKLFCGYDGWMLVGDMVGFICVFGYLLVMLVGYVDGGLVCWIIVLLYLWLVCVIVLISLLYFVVLW